MKNLYITTPSNLFKIAASVAVWIILLAVLNAGQAHAAVNLNPDPGSTATAIPAGWENYLRSCDTRPYTPSLVQWVSPSSPISAESVTINAGTSSIPLSLNSAGAVCYSNSVVSSNSYQIKSATISNGATISGLNGGRSISFSPYNVVGTYGQNSLQFTASKTGGFSQGTYTITVVYEGINTRTVAPTYDCTRTSGSPIDPGSSSNYAPCEDITTTFNIQVTVNTPTTDCSSIIMFNRVEMPLINLSYAPSQGGIERTTYPAGGGRREYYYRYGYGLDNPEHNVNWVSPSMPYSHNDYGGDYGHGVMLDYTNYINSNPTQTVSPQVNYHFRWYQAGTLYVRQYNASGGFISDGPSSGGSGVPPPALSTLAQFNSPSNTVYGPSRGPCPTNYNPGNYGGNYAGGDYGGNYAGGDYGGNYDPGNYANYSNAAVDNVDVVARHIDTSTNQLIPFGWSLFRVSTEQSFADAARYLINSIANPMNESFVYNQGPTYYFQIYEKENGGDLKWIYACFPTILGDTPPAYAGDPNADCLDEIEVTAADLSDQDDKYSGLLSFGLAPDKTEYYLYYGSATPPTTPTVTCEANQASVAANASVTFNRTGGTATGPYTWSGDLGSSIPPSTAPFTTSYGPPAATRTVTITQQGRTGSCSVNVTVPPFTPGAPRRLGPWDSITNLPPIL